MPPDLWTRLFDIGGTAVVAVVALIGYSRFFLKPGNGVDKQILATLEKQNENHLNHIRDEMSQICDSVNNGNERVVKAITDMHLDLASRLGELKGTMGKR
jgi:hypothetical protein